MISWSRSSSTLATWCKEPIHWKRFWSWERVKARGEGDNRGWDGWMAPPTRWAWVWANSGSLWWTGKTGVLPSMGSQRVGHNWATELKWHLIQRKFQATAPRSLASSSSMFILDLFVVLCASILCNTFCIECSAQLYNFKKWNKNKLTYPCSWLNTVVNSALPGRCPSSQFLVEHQLLVH